MSFFDKIFPKTDAAAQGGSTKPAKPLKEHFGGLKAKLSKKPAAATQAAPATGPTSLSQSELLQQRDALTRQRQELQWDLGGLVYEMSIRDHFRLDVVVARAAKLRETDAQLAEVKRQLAQRNLI